MYNFHEDIRATATNIRPSPAGIFNVHGYKAYEGQAGEPLEAIVECIAPKYIIQSPLSFRLVIGNKAIRTVLSQSPHSSCFELKAVVPTIPMYGSISAILGLVVQVVDGDGDTLDSLAFGHFLYLETAIASFFTPIPTKVEQTVSPNILSFQPRIMKRSDTDSTTMSGSTAFSRTASDSSQDHDYLTKAKLHQVEQNDDDLKPLDATPYFHSKDDPMPLLEILSPIEPLATGWTEEEVERGRRLVQFTQIRTAKQILISCEVIKEVDYEPDMIVVSCIRRAGTVGCHITSVDILSLIESIAGEEFSVDEKNRVRRNVECFKPLTLSKSNNETVAFFQQVMDLPEPQPRNLSKTIKVFPWNKLEPALVKVLSKYALAGSRMDLRASSTRSRRPSPESKGNVRRGKQRTRTISPVDISLLKLAISPDIENPAFNYVPLGLKREHL